MTTRTEQALRALVAALGAASTLPQPVRRNQIYDDLAEELNAQQSALVNIIDGNARVDNIFLGDEGFELKHIAEIEWIVLGVEDADREATFDAGLVAIEAALAADRHLGLDPAWMLDARIVEPPERDMDIVGARAAKTAKISVQLHFTSPNPF